MNIEEKLVSRDVEVRFGAAWATRVFIDGEQVKDLTFVGISHGVDDLSPVLVLEFWEKGTRGKGRVEIPIRGVFKGKGLGGET